MNDELRLAELEVRLGKSPYAPDLIVEHCLLLACLGRHDESQRCVSILKGFDLRGPSLDTLWRAASGLANVERVGDDYLMGHVGASKSEWIGAIQQSHDCLQAYVSRPREALLIEAASDGRINTASFDLRGLCHVTLTSDGLARRGVLASVAHELAHCYLRGAGRFLDEGWAFYIQHCVDRASNYPATSEEMVRWSSCRKDLVDLRVLLTLPQKVGPLFEGAVANDAELRSVYAQGYELVAHIIRERGVAAFLQLVDRLRDCAPGARAVVFGDVFGCRVQTLQCQLSRQDSEASGAELQLAHIRRDLTRGRASRNSQYYIGHIAPLREHLRRNPDNEDGQLLLGQLLVSGFFSEVGRSGNRRDAYLWEAEAIANDLRRSPSLVAPELLQGLVAQARAAVAPALSKAEWGVVARLHLESAYVLTPDEPEVLLALARQDLNTPAQYGGDRTRAKSLLAQVETHVEYADEIGSMHAHYGI